MLLDGWMGRWLGYGGVSMDRVWVGVACRHTGVDSLGNGDGKGNGEVRLMRWGGGWESLGFHY